MLVTVETVMTKDAYYGKNHFEQLWGRFHTRRLFKLLDWSEENHFGSHLKTVDCKRCSSRKVVGWLQLISSLTFFILKLNLT